MSDSDITTAIYKVNENWLDVDERDRAVKGFDNNSGKLAGSGLVVGVLPSDKTYTGSKITFTEDELRIYYGGRLLKNGTDYKVSYANNTKAFTLDDGETFEDLDAAALKKAPKITISTMGSLSGKKVVYFEIQPRSILADLNIKSGSMFTELAKNKKVTAVPAMSTTINGKTVKLKSGTDFEVFYNPIVDGVVDYGTKLTAAAVMQDYETNNHKLFLVNAQGIGNYTGTLGSIAPRLTIASDDEVRLDKASVSRSLPIRTYKNGEQISDEFVEMFVNGDITAKVGKTKLTYLADKDAATVTEDGYYFTVIDPADTAEGAELNRYPGTNNYIELVPTVIPVETGYRNYLVGSKKLTFRIKGNTISFKNIVSTLPYTGNPIYNGVDGLVAQNDKEAVQKKLFNNNKGVLKAGIDRMQVFSGALELDANSDAYTMTLQGDTGAVGTLKVTFTGNIKKGYTGSVSKKIKIQAQKLKKTDVKVYFNDPSEENTFVPEYEYEPAGVKPQVKVRLGNTDLVENVDYKLSYTGNKNAGKVGSVSVKFIGAYSGSISKARTFKVVKADLTTASDRFSIKCNDVVMGKFGKTFKSFGKAAPVLYDGTKKLKLNTDYVYASAPVYYYAEDYVMYDAENKEEVIGVIPRGTVIADDSKAVGAGTTVGVRFSILPGDKGSYKISDSASAVEFETTYRIGAFDISKATIKVKSQTYIGDGVEVIPSISDITFTPARGAAEFRPDDYKIVGFENNTKAGTAVMYVQGNGRYCGVKKVTFKIVKGTSNK